jgi:hypothetical protein
MNIKAIAKDEKGRKERLMIDKIQKYNELA